MSGLEADCHIRVFFVWSVVLGLEAVTTTSVRAKRRAASLKFNRFENT